MEQNDQFDSKAIDLLLNTARNEYQNEHSRTSVIDSKTSIALPIISAYFLALSQMNDYKSIVYVKIDSFFDIIIPTILFITYTASLILALIAVIKMTHVITTRSYNTIKSSDLYDEDFLKNDQSALAVELIRLYIEATSKNKEQNDLRIPLYKQGWQFTIISIVAFVIYIIIKNCI